MAKWSDRLTRLKEISKDIDYIMCIDENDCSNIEHAINKIKTGQNLNDDEKYFSITGCIFTRENYLNTDLLINNLKLKYWENGKIQYKNELNRSVSLHSQDIRRHDLCFNDSLINYNQFMEELSNTLKIIDCSIISVGINIENYIKKKYTHDILCNKQYKKRNNSFRIKRI